MIATLLASVPPAEPNPLDSFGDMLVAGGPFMVPIGLCSVVALGYGLERLLRLTPGSLGLRKLGRELVPAVRSGGPERGLELCAAESTPLARVMHTALARRGEPFLEREKAVEDAGSRELRRLGRGLKPLVVVAMIAPLLGLLGTVWGMILAFSTIALRDGLGRPELLAAGISQALITTAAGLAIAIPAQALYYYLKGRIERFASTLEDLHGELVASLREQERGDAARA